MTVAGPFSEKQANSPAPLIETQAVYIQHFAEHFELVKIASHLLADMTMPTSRCYL